MLRGLSGSSLRREELPSHAIGFALTLGASGRSLCLLCPPASWAGGLSQESGLGLFQACRQEQAWDTPETILMLFLPKQMPATNSKLCWKNRNQCSLEQGGRPLRSSVVLAPQAVITTG